MTADMRTIEVKAILTYDADIMHGSDPEAREWFYDILHGDDLQLADFGDLGDMIGAIKIVELKEPK